MLHASVVLYMHPVPFLPGPEVILGTRYGMSTDVWTLVELLPGYFLLPGKDEENQLPCMIELLSMPSQKLLDAPKWAKNLSAPRFIPVTALPCLSQIPLWFSMEAIPKGRTEGPTREQRVGECTEGVWWPPVPWFLKTMFRMRSFSLNDPWPFGTPGWGGGCQSLQWGRRHQWKGSILVLSYQFPSYLHLQA